MRLYSLRPIITPVLIITGAAFLFMVAGCGKQPPAPERNTAKPSAGQAAVKTPASDESREQPAGESELYKPEQEDGPKLELSQEGIEITWMEKGAIRMKASARQSQFDGTKRVGSLKGFSATLYENGKPATKMSAPNVLCDTVQRTITADGGVVLTSIETKSTVKSDWMKWFSRKQKVVGSGGVQAELMQPDSTVWNMSGPGFVADTALQSVTIRPLVKGQDF